MIQNMGSTDKLIRLVVAIIILGLYFTNIIGGTVAIILGVLALVFSITSFLGFCPLYVPFGFSTKEK
jgi:hypothetical protein